MDPFDRGDAIGGNYLEGDKVDARALKDLIRAAIAYNQTKLKKNAPAGARAKARKKKKS